MATKKKLYIIPLELADCTCDPHSVATENIKAALEGIAAVCADDVIQYVEAIQFVARPPGEEDTGDYEREEKEWTWQSDCYSVSNYLAKEKDGKKVVTAAKTAAKAKLPPYFWQDATCPPARHLRHGLLGVQDLVTLIPKLIEEGYTVHSLHIDVVWRFAGDSSCSDDISIESIENLQSPVKVEVNSQDWWAENEGHDETYVKVGEIFGVEVDMSGCVKGRY